MHRQTKGAATDMFYLMPTRHISTLEADQSGRSRDAGRLGRFRRVLCLHKSGVIEDGLVGIGHRERSDRIVECLALARVAGNCGGIARSCVGAREGTAT